MAALRLVGLVCLVFAAKTFSQPGRFGCAEFDPHAKPGYLCYPHSACNTTSGEPGICGYSPTGVPAPWGVEHCICLNKTTTTEDPSLTEYSCSMPNAGFKCVPGHAGSPPWSQKTGPLTLSACRNWCDSQPASGAGCCSWSHFDGTCYMFTNSSMSSGPDYLYSSTCQTEAA